MSARYDSQVSRSLRSVVRRALPHALYRRYRGRLIASAISQYEPHEVTHRYGGHELRIRLADPLAQGWYDCDWEESPVMALLREHGVLVPGARIFDLGAHQAVVALMLVREAGAEGHVVAVEAEPHNARVAAENRELNGASNLTVIHAAAAAAEGSLSFAVGLNGTVDQRAVSGNVTVRAVTVDQLAAQFGVPDLVFIDVEGYEAHVLRGAISALTNGTTSFVVEVHETITNFGDSTSAIVDRFRDFTCYVAANDRDPFQPLEGTPPRGRFFLVAFPESRASRAADNATA